MKTFFGVKHFFGGWTFFWELKYFLGSWTFFLGVEHFLGVERFFGELWDYLAIYPSCKTNSWLLNCFTFLHKIPHNNFHYLLSEIVMLKFWIFEEGLYELFFYYNSYHFLPSLSEFIFSFCMNLRRSFITSWEVLDYVVSVNFSKYLQNIYKISVNVSFHWLE